MTSETSEAKTAAETLVDEIRHLIQVARTSDLDAASTAGIDLAAVTAQIAVAAEMIESHVVEGQLMQAGLHAKSAFFDEGRLPNVEGDRRCDFFPYSPAIGKLNPIAPPFTFIADGAETRGFGRFPAAFCGPPDGVHGGHVAALLDELLGTTGVLSGQGGFTGTLTVKYLRLTPIETDLTVHGWVERVEGRKIIICGEIRHDDTVCAAGEGIFIRPRPIDDPA